MHQYFDLVYRAAAYTLSALAESEKLVRQGHGNTATVKNLQAIRLQKAIMAIGMFSLFESVVQDSTKSKNGFAEVRRCLDAQKEIALAKRFSQFYAAVNVLKHGRGESYETLLGDNQLPFRIERPGAPLFVEYDSRLVVSGSREHSGNLRIVSILAGAKYTLLVDYHYRARMEFF